jgi:ribosomal protein L15
VKILSKGDYNIKLNITAHQFSVSAQKIIEDNGGSVTTVE